MKNSLIAPRRRSGFTLVEVVIALALFVFGALAIVRIFPPALGVIRNNESRTTAVQVGQTMLARLEGKNSPPPEAVFDVDAASTQAYLWNDYAGAVTGTVTKNSSLPKSPIDIDYDASALGHFRYIYGEPHYIGAGQTILLNHPRASTLGATTIPVTAFYDDVVEGVQIGSDGVLDFSSAHLASSPGVAFNDAANPTRPPDTYRRPEVTYYVSYRWREYIGPSPTNYTSIKGLIEEPLSIPLNSAWASNSGRVLAGVVNTLNRVIPGGIEVRMRKSVTVTPVSTGDPQNAIVSISAGAPGLYYVSYLASEWRSLAYDAAPLPKVGAAGTSTIRLPINGIDDSFPAFGVLTRSDQKVAPATVAPTNVDYKKGEIDYPVAIDGPRIRTIFRALDGWATQLSVAPRSYIPYDVARAGADFPREPWREYSWSSTDGSNIYFHPSEAGKTVAISFLVVDALNPNGKVVNSVCTVGDDILATPAAVSAAFTPSGKVSRLEITDAAGTTVAAAAILSVQGLSVQARTAWLNNDRYTQVIVPSYRTLTN
jgi:prepilin-type N-terminal cleavage/methylation domain-containing protein